MTAKVGPAGNSDRFYSLGHQSALEVPRYLNALSLTAYEYQCGRGVNIGEEKARALGREAEAYGVALSLHAPYYISLSSTEPEKRDKSIDYLLQSAQAVDWMGGRRVILHSGSAGKLDRGEALALATETLTRARAALDEAGFAHILLCPETMGKLNQLGTLEEVLALCAIDERMLPCIDFGHLNARSGGGLVGRADYAAVLDAVERALGPERLRVFHSHFSKIEYTAGGEKRHLNFEDQPSPGPDFEPLAQLIVERGLAPTLICESAGHQDLDAVAMLEALARY
ncbi:MAG: TIM barrel protein [Clostridiales bacterium]|nr:TIM barrel protein [Clostridiales bacterium]